MKKFSLLMLAAGLSLAATSSSFANKNLWQSFAGKTAPSQNPKPSLPSNYTIVKLDQEGIKQLLGRAGTSFETGVELSVPTPTGEFKNFKVWNTPVMESTLQAQYPDIQTYTGSLIGDPSQTIKVSTGAMGVFIRSFAFDMNDVFAIEPYGFDANGYYTLSSAKDFFYLPKTGTCNPETVTTTPLTGDAPAQVNPETGKIAQRTLGTSRRTYRMALSCTGEYAAAVSGSPNPTVSQILAIMTATVNNANGLWEREISVSMMLVNNNTAVIYLDPNTDPYYDDANHDSLLTENQKNMGIFIGNGNYDIGHIFTQSGGGLAGLGVVCGSSSKAKGQSGNSGPTDIGTFTHEVGHQLGAGHTFTSEAGGCSGNGMAESAYEPGSGTTIMSYNGACGADNTPLFTTPMTDYYNRFNLKQMQEVLTTSGATCGTTVLGQTPVMMTDMMRRYIIPANTPFELIANEATTTVASNSAPVYCWEQSDKGPITMVEANGSSVAVGPIFSSLPSTVDKARAFPRYSQLAQNIYSASGERLPNVSRDMSYKVTVRSISQDGWGTNNTTDSGVGIKVVSSGMGDFRVTGPADANLVWEPAQVYPIDWTIGNTLNAPDSILAGTVNIYLSLDGGLSFPIILATNVPNTGTFNITAPNYMTSAARVKVKAVGNVFFDVSKTSFKVNGTLGIKGQDIASSIQVFPNPAQQMLTVTNKAFDGKELKLTLMNALGQEVWTGGLKTESTQINVGQLAKGTYFLYFRDDSSAKYGVKQVVVQ